MTDSSRKCRVIFRAKAFFAVLGSFLGAAGLSAGSTSAASLKLLWSFCAVVSCNDGKFPLAGPIIDGKGNLYGTASNGGGGNNGVMFFLPPTKSFKVLHAFQGTDGSAPEAPLLGTRTGNLYGTTFYGGAFRVGTVFVRSVSGVYTVVHSFTGPDGSAPAAGLIADASGNFYGTTSGGGASGFGGTIFKIAPGGALTTLHSFCSMTGCPGGYNPVAGLCGRGAKQRPSPRDID
jgi:uncharacterized repeat protein (TIGR03803 family)